MATLYEMTETARALYSMFENEEIDEQILQDTLESLGVDLKIEDCCKVIRQLSADAEAYKKEKEMFTKKEQSAKKAVERIKNSIIAYMQTVGKKEEKTDLFTVRVSESKAVNVLNIDLLPKELLRETVKIEPDKKSIGALLKAGKTVEGAELQINRNIQIK